MQPKKNRIIIAAEVGNTHEGSVALAERFIAVAAECGVDAVKFQAHIFQAESLPDAPNPPYFSNESRREYLERTVFDLRQWKRLARCAAEHQLLFVCSPFCEPAVDLLEQAGVQVYKIASGEVTNLPLLRRVGATHKPVWLSSGMSSWDELDRAVETLRGAGCGQLTVLQCTSRYPCPPEEAGLANLPRMAERYGVPAGFSDHTLGLGASVAAACLGARVIEKHFTLSRKMYGPDAPFSAEPEHLAALVVAVREGLAAAGELDKDRSAAELAGMKQVFEKSLTTVAALGKGERLETRHLACRKPGTGIPAADLERALGRVAARDIPADTLLGWDMLTPSENES